MNDLNPREYFNGEPIDRPAAVPVSEVAVAAGETVTSASPKVELGKSKAVVAAVGGVVTAVAMWLTGDPFADGAIDLGEGIALAFAIAGGLGIPGLGTYLMPTTVTGTSKR